jgi:hypothetical protein
VTLFDNLEKRTRQYKATGAGHSLPQALLGDKNK